MSKTMLFELHGFKVMSDSVYITSDKKDFSGPTGFQDAGITKLPSDGVGHTFQCPFKRFEGTNEGVWDTGFYALSPCYENMNPERVKIIVKNLLENVVEPYRRATGNKLAFDQENTEFFDKTMFSVETEKVYRTSNPRQVVSLYFALLSRELVPKDRVNDASFNKAAYVIEDSSETIRKKDEAASDMFEAIGVFEELYKSEKERLDKILYYLGQNMSDDTNKAAYRSMFKNFLEVSTANTEAFINLVRESESDKGIAKLNIYHALKSKGSNDSRISKSNGIIYYNGEEVGVDLKSAAENLAVNPKLSEQRKELLFDESSATQTQE